MTPDDDLCGICRQEPAGLCAVPTCNGDIVSNAIPDDLWEGSLPVCEACYAKHERGQIPVADRRYVPRAPLSVDLIQGGGI